MVKAHREVLLEDWLAGLKHEVERATTDGRSVGACLVADPRTGDNVCVLMDAASCGKVGGTFIGGPCGSFTVRK
jgi:hypothetical protein